MVIQSIMSPKSIVMAWEETKDIFEQHDIPLTDEKLQTLVNSNLLPEILRQLNTKVNSTSQTCIAGG